MRKEVRKGLAQAGFTLFELVIVMVILGILAVFVIPKVAPTEMTLQSAANLVLTDLRHTQALSMTSGQRYRL